VKLVSWEWRCRAYPAKRTVERIKTIPRFGWYRRGTSWACWWWWWWRRTGWERWDRLDNKTRRWWWRRGKGGLWRRRS